MVYEVVNGDNVILTTEDSFEAYGLAKRKNDLLPYNRTPLFVRHVLKVKAHNHTISDSIGCVSAFRFWFDNGYAFYYLDEYLGVFQIYSDWGNFAYRWPSCTRTESLVDFLKGADKYYLAKKLTIELHGETKKFDLNRTLAHLRFLICDKRRRNKITSCKARELWNWLLDIQAETDRDLFDNEIFSHLECEAEDVFVYTTCDSVVFLRESLIPFFINYLRTEAYSSSKYCSACPECSSNKQANT